MAITLDEQRNTCQNGGFFRNPEQLDPCFLIPAYSELAAVSGQTVADMIISPLFACHNHREATDNR